VNQARARATCAEPAVRVSPDQAEAQNTTAGGQLSTLIGRGAHVLGTRHQGAQEMMRAIENAIADTGPVPGPDTTRLSLVRPGDPVPSRAITTPVVAELQSLQAAHGVWGGCQLLWVTPHGPGERSHSQAFVLASTRQLAVVMALRWRTQDQDYDAMLVLDKAPDGQQITGQWSGTHPRTPANLTLSGGAAARHGIVLHGSDSGGDRPWEITIGRTKHNITLTVYDGAGCRPELPVMHATYTHQAGHRP
jgi:hypothetical protein